MRQPFPAASHASLDAFLASLPLGGAPPTSGGGTPARAQCFSAAGQEWVVKYLRDGRERVDGHDLDTFTRKLDQIRLVRTHCPGLAPHYVDVVSAYRGPDGAALVMPYYGGAGAMDLLAAGPPAFAAWYGDVITRLVTDGYTVRRSPAPHGALEDFYLSRVTRRMPFLERWLPADALADRLVINGQECRSPRLLMHDILEDTVLAQQLSPATLFFPVHGDLNLGNIRLDPSSGHWVIIDPRGTVDDWDLVYDIAKGILSLVVFEHALMAGFRLVRERSGPVPHWRVEPGAVGQGSALAAAEQTLAAVGRHAALNAALDGDRWTLRLRYAVAFHALADAACRISDDKFRVHGRARGIDARIELALGLWLVGTLLLERLVRAGEAAETVPLDWRAP